MIAIQEIHVFGTAYYMSQGVALLHEVATQDESWLTTAALAEKLSLSRKSCLKLRNTTWRAGWIEIVQASKHGFGIFITERGGEVIQEWQEWQEWKLGLEDVA